MNPVPRWRIAAAFAVLAALLGFGALFTPIYLDNLKLQSYVAELTRRADSQTQIRRGAPCSSVADQGHALDLPVKADNVQMSRTTDGTADRRALFRTREPARVHGGSAFLPGRGQSLSLLPDGNPA